MQRKSFHHNRNSAIRSSTYRPLSSKIKNVLLLLLVLGLALSLVWGIPAVQSQKNYRGDVIARMETECGDAQYILAHLSNTGSSSTYAQLARIRSAIYAIDVLNQSYSSLQGASSLVDSQLLNNVYTLVESYYTALISSATNTSILLSDLSAALQSLQSALAVVR